MPDAEDERPIAGIVLAAGTSSRMGRNKMLLEVCGEPLVRRVARTAFESGLSPVVVIVGHEAEGVRGALMGVDCRTVFNAEYAGPPRHAFAGRELVRLHLHEAAVAEWGPDALRDVDLPEDYARVRAALET